MGRKSQTSRPSGKQPLPPGALWLGFLRYRLGHAMGKPRRRAGLRCILTQHFINRGKLSRGPQLAGLFDSLLFLLLLQFRDLRVHGIR
ncbi:MAG: hypothetical protein DME23_17595 [Verrucomicrobia bacterium]|nr:MAG: hypothetical protein DME23_17595 [Verrucomicrobiota bacterium]